MMGDERRKHIRVFVPNGQVRLVSGPIFALIGKVMDISVGGLKFQSESELAIGEVLGIEIVLPSGAKFKCSAQIIYTSPCKEIDTQWVYGSKFVNISEQELAELGEYIMQLKARQDGLLRDEFGN